MARLSLEAYRSADRSNSGVGFVLRGDGRNFVCAVQGTDSLGDWAVNANAIPKKTRTITAHRGFLRVAARIYDDIATEVDAAAANSCTLRFTGHSMGGAVAQLLAEWARRLHPTADVRCVAFGAPPVFVRWYSPIVHIRQYQIDDDPVPRIMGLVPVLRWGLRAIYHHKGFVVSRETPGFLSVADHGMDHYLEVFADELG